MSKASKCIARRVGWIQAPPPPAGGCGVDVSSSVALGVIDVLLKQHNQNRCEKRGGEAVSFSLRAPRVSAEGARERERDQPTNQPTTINDKQLKPSAETRFEAGEHKLLCFALFATSLAPWQSGSETSLSISPQPSTRWAGCCCPPPHVIPLCAPGSHSIHFPLLVYHLKILFYSYAGGRSPHRLIEVVSWHRVMTHVHILNLIHYVWVAGLPGGMEAMAKGRS